MSAATQVIFATVEKYTCCHENCGIVFGLEQGFVRHRRQDHKGWYCPNGHLQYFLGENEAERLKKELERQKAESQRELAKEQQRRKWAEESRDMANKREDRAKRKAAAFKGIVTKTKKRVGNGVCPCCNRTFANLMNHMKTQHPKYKETRK